MDLTPPRNSYFFSSQLSALSYQLLASSLPFLIPIGVRRLFVHQVHPRRSACIRGKHVLFCPKLLKTSDLRPRPTFRLPLVDMLAFGHEALFGRWQAVSGTRPEHVEGWPQNHADQYFYD